MNIYQHVVEFNTHDGIGNDIIGIKKLSEKDSISCKIITSNNRTGFSELDVLNSKDLKKIKFKPSDIHIIHYGSPGYPIRELRNIPGKKILRFHNLTPYYFNYHFTNKETFKVLKISYHKAIMEIQSLSFDMDEYWFDSKFNLQTFSRMLNRDISNKKQIIQPIFREYIFTQKKIFNENKINLLYTGRIVPHKKVEDLIFIMYYLLKFNINYRLIIVGKLSSLFVDYKNYLDMIISELRLSDSIEWHEDISEDALHEIRNKSQFYLTMSEHEGFCIPILESFAAGIPVCAFNAGSVSETMRNAGILINQKNHLYIATLLDTLSKKSDILKNIQKNQFEVIKSINEISSLTDLLK